MRTTNIVKIASVESIQLRIPFAGEDRLENGSWGGKGLPTVDSLIVKVITDTVLVGWGETFGFAGIPAAKAAIDSILAPAVVGRDAAQMDKLMLDLQRQFHIFGRSGAVIFGLSAIDIALWDIAGKLANQPVHALLGGSDTTSLRRYASLVRYSDPSLVKEHVGVR
jgi:L-alanine-DL-glutamate epimerase-like enolase superfamily enzyme